VFYAFKGKTYHNFMPYGKMGTYLFGVEFNTINIKEFLELKKNNKWQT